MSELSQSTQKLIQDYKNWYYSLEMKEGVLTIHVDEVASRVASFYEKIRGIIDWREERLLRKTAIERILRRRLFLGKEGEKIASSLVHELIRGGHFPNDRIEESKIKEVQRLIEKYIFIIENSPSGQNNQKMQLYNWLSGIAACELEDILSPHLREKALIEYMYQLMKERIKVREKVFTIGGIKEGEKNTQIYITVQQALFKLDESLITYHLLQKRYPNWSNLERDQLIAITENISLIWENIQKVLSHPLANKFYQICERYSTPYLLLGDIISEDPIKTQERISKPEVLEGLIRKSYNKRLKTLKSRLRRAAFYSTLSIFLTNILVLLAIEIPLVKYITGDFNFLSIGVDILGPTFLMAFLVLTIRPPKKGNLEQVVMEMMRIVYKRETKDVYEVKTSPKRSFLVNIIINLFYLISFCLSFSLIIFGLYKINFPPLSYLIFIAFISLIAFAGAKIRERSKELQVTPERGTFLGFLIDVISLPVLGLGKWLSAKWRKYNVLAVLFSSLIDLPFQAFVEFLEHWSFFLKEKKEKIH